MLVELAVNPDLHRRRASRAPGGFALARPLAALAGTLILEVAGAAPHAPASDSVVLERLPAAGATAKLAPLRARQKAHPEDRANALQLAQGYLDIGRANGDPRFASYAEATLAPWVAGPDATPEVLTVAADTLQYLHRFSDALRLLDRALRIEPGDGHAWLLKASVLQVQGEYVQAREACRHLPRVAGQLIALTCLTSINSLSGDLRTSYAALRTVFRDDARLAPGVRVWILDQLADMAERSGADPAAEEDFTAALVILPQDGFTKAAYADLLLRQHRDAEVVELLRGDEQQDNLLLRLAIAATRQGDIQAHRWSELFQARYEAARRDGDYTHLREQARFLLEVRRNAAEALAIAERNWSAQREPADVRVFLMAAQAAGDHAALGTIVTWIRQMHYEDRTLQPPVPSA